MILIPVRYLFTVKTGENGNGGYRNLIAIKYPVIVPEHAFGELFTIFCSTLDFDMNENKLFFTIPSVYFHQFVHETGIRSIPGVGRQLVQLFVKVFESLLHIEDLVSFGENKAKQIIKDVPQQA